MKNTKEIDLSPAHRKLVEEILIAHIPDAEVWVFGSRAKGTAWRYSDLDLAVVRTEPLGYGLSDALREAFEESDLPFTVDFVEWPRISEQFREAIGPECALLRCP